MTTQAEDTAVRSAIVVDAPRDLAFDVFANDIGSWWPPDHHVIDAELERMVFEPRVGGRVYDVGVDGSECQWARVLVFDPPERLMFSWDLTTAWTIETDPARASEVEVRFVAEGPERTRVELEHRHLDRHGDGWQGVRGAVGSAGGWPAGLEAFARRVREVPAG
jgi:uncharacterized protein YndB with AHSA1/START domain